MERLAKSILVYDGGRKMIRFVKRESINDKKWDKCISQAHTPMVYALSWYLDCVSPNWSALIEGDYERVMPLPTKSKWGIHYIIQPIFVQQLGIFSALKTNSETEKHFINAIPKKFRWCHINMNEKHDANLYQFQNINFVLSLKASYEAILKGYSSKCRRNVKLTLKENFYTKNSTNAPELISFFRQEKGDKLTNIGDKEYAQLEKLMNTSIEKGLGQIRFCYTINKELVAGIFFLKFQNRIYNLLSTANYAGRKTRALYFIIDQIIQEHSETESIFDFEGSNVRDIARFFESFGSINQPYPTLKFNRLPFPLRLLKK